jgi:hypothetical protein
MKCLTFLFKIFKDNEDFFSIDVNMILKQKQNNKIGLIGVCSNCYNDENNQGYDKKMYPKLMLNRLKVMKNSTSIYTY